MMQPKYRPNDTRNLVGPATHHVPSLARRYKPPRPKRDPTRRGVTVTRYPWAPLIPVVGTDTSAIAEWTGQSRRTVQRWIENGLTAKDADWLATIYGDSAGRLWRDTTPSWYDVETTEADDIWYDAWLRGEDIPS